MKQPSLYESLASWWPLMSAPADYEEEAGIYTRLLRQARDGHLGTLLELGSGGGNNASFMKSEFVETVLVDLSPQMIEISRALNPECEHMVGDMRSVRLHRQFDCVFVHDAVCYMTTEVDLKLAMETAFVHCCPGGVALFCPGHLREQFEPSTDHGGDDGVDRSMRYLEWTWDPDPSDTQYLVDYVYMMRSGDGNVRIEHDRHVEGLFAHADWVRLLEDVGFEVQTFPFEHTEVPPGTMELFLARRPAVVRP